MKSGREGGPTALGQGLLNANSTHCPLLNRVDGHREQSLLAVLQQGALVVAAR